MSEDAAPKNVRAPLCCSAAPRPPVDHLIAIRCRSALLALLLVLAPTAGGCAAVGGIFKAGLWSGVIIAVVVVVLVLFLVRSISR